MLVDASNIIRMKLQKLIRVVSKLKSILFHEVHGFKLQ